MVAISQRPWGTELLVAGYFNTDMEALEGHDQYKTIAAAMAKEGLEYMESHLIPCHCLWTRDGRTWSIICNLQEVISRMD